MGGHLTPTPNGDHPRDATARRPAVLDEPFTDAAAVGVELDVATQRTGRLDCR
jgi:hypothetical protein